MTDRINKILMDVWVADPYKESIDEVLIPAKQAITELTLKQVLKMIDSTVMIITKDLPSLMSMDEVARIREQHKAELRQSAERIWKI